MNSNLLSLIYTCIYVTMLGYCTVIQRRNNIMNALEHYGVSDQETEQVSAIVNQNPELLNGYDNALNDTEIHCHSCRIREGKRQLRLHSIRAKLSHALRIDVLGLPNVTRSRLPKVPSYERLLQQYETQLNLNEMQNDQQYSYAEQIEDEEEEFGQMQRTFVFSEYPPTALGIEAPNAFYFNLSDMENRFVHQAHLWVYIEPRSQYSLPHNVTEMFLYKLVSPGKRSGPPVKRFLKKRKKSVIETSGWHQFDVTEVVHSWVTNPSSNLGLVVESLDINNENLIILPSGLTANNNGYEPNLDFKTTTALHNNRRKRSVGIECDDQNQFETCCRYPLTVHFEEFKWDFVIAPLHYDAYYCGGECRNEGLSESGHSAVFQQVPESRIIGGTNPGPCCTPVRMSSLTMLYFDHNLNVQLTTLPKMKVERCGCA